MSIRDIRWIDFEKKNINKAEAFEKMCTHLFCRRYNLSSEDISQVYNQPGVEIYPITKNNDVIGFQCKYCNTTSNFYSEVKKSLIIAFEKYPQLTEIVLYTQLKIGEPDDEKSQRKNSAKNSIERLCTEKGCKVEFFSNIQFDIALSENPDIYDYYFSDEKIDKLFKDSVSIEDRTFLNSKDYFDLNINNNRISALISDFENEGVFAVEGRAGTGKTEILKKIFINLEKKYSIESKDKSKTIKPIFIRFREVSSNDLLSKILLLKHQYKLNDDRCLFSYFFDGVDEIDITSFMACVSTIKEINGYEDTYSIYLSSRLDSQNYFVLKSELKNLKVFLINPLDENDKMNYVSNICNNTKILDNIKQILSENSNMFNDIFSLRMLCENIGFISNDITMIELLDLHFKSIEKFNFKKILTLDLPTSQFESLKNIAIQVSFLMTKTEKLHISIKELQEIILNQYPNINYKNLNTIIETILMLFFDVKEDFLASTSIAMFRHKRYYEYFLYHYLKIEMYNDPFVLRELNIFSKREFFVAFLLTQELKDSFNSKDYFKSHILGLILSHMNYDYCSLYFNKWINSNNVCEYNDLTFYDKSFVDYLCLLSTDEIKLYLSNDELVYGSFINSHNNCLLLYLYLVKNKEDISWLFEGMNINLNSFEEEGIYYNLFQYLLGESNKIDIQDEVFALLDRMPTPNGKEHISDIRNGENYNLRIIIKHFIDNDIDFLIDLISKNKMTQERFNKLGYVLLNNKTSWIFPAMNNDLLNELKTILLEKIKNFENICEDICTQTLLYLLDGTIISSEVASNYITSHNVNHLMTWSDAEELLSPLVMAIKNKPTLYHQEYQIVSDLKKELFKYRKVDEKEIIDNLIIIINRYTYSWSNFFTHGISIFISQMMAKLEFDSSSIKIFLKKVKPEKINKFVMLYNIFTENKVLFLNSFDYDYINKAYENDKYNLNYYDTSSQAQIMFANMTILFDKEKFYVNISKSINIAVFRLMFSKDPTVCYLEPETLAVAIENNLFKNDENEIYLQKNLHQMDASKETVTRSNNASYLKYLFEKVKPIYEYSFDYQIEAKNPIEIKNDFSLKKFNLDVFISDNYKQYNIYSINFWSEGINCLKNNDKLDLLYEFLKKSHYPSFYWNSISSVSYLIIAALIKGENNQERLFEFLFSKLSLEGFYQFICACIYSGKNDMSKKLIDLGYKLVDVMTFYDKHQCITSKYKVKIDKKIMRIIYNSNVEDYFHCDNVLLYEKDLDIFIKEPDFSDDNDDYSEFNADWAKCFGSRASRLVYRVYYKGHLIYCQVLINVDDGRANIPLLDSITGEYKNEDYNFARLFTEKETLNQYIYMCQHNIIRNNKQEEK